MTVNLFGRNTIFGLGDEQIDEDAEKLDIPIHAFDLIIADECHRGYTSAELAVWRQTLDHFDAIKIGLTATPAAHTTAYFKNVVYRYEYERAVREGFLVDYDVVAIKSNVRMQGVFLKEGEAIGLVDSESGAKKLDLVEDERQFDASEVERNITSPDSNRKILEEVKKHALEHEQRTGRFPKILIFAANDLPHTSANFVHDNPAHIEAIGILLDRPQDWSTESLIELKKKLAASPERFTPEHLQKAHEIRYRKALVDIISMVKHAADGQNPLLTAVERVERAFMKVTAGKAYTPEQQQWLKRIREHLRENLSIGKDDFEELPVFNRYGGWGRISTVFGPDLPKLIQQLNQAIAA